MAPFGTLLGTWGLDPVAAVVIVVLAALYLLGVRRVRAGGGEWRGSRTALFFVLGLGAYAVVEFGFLGYYSHDLRYAFTTRVALLLFVIPACLASGRPLTLLREALHEPARARLERVLGTRILRLFGNALFAAIFSAIVFALFLTPLAWVARGTPAIDSALSVIVPAVGLLMVLPIAENTDTRASIVVTIEFLFAFIELLIDAVPGIVMRLSTSILDGAPAIHQALAWWPSPLRDQQLAGDILWFIAEASDLPVLIWLFVRWSRSDRREAKSFDDLSDEEYEAMTREHLRGPRGD